jgi:hypothetical protein
MTRKPVSHKERDGEGDGGRDTAIARRPAYSTDSFGLKVREVIAIPRLGHKDKETERGRLAAHSSSRCATGDASP